MNDKQMPLLDPTLSCMWLPKRFMSPQGFFAKCEAVEPVATLRGAEYKTALTSVRIHPDFGSEELAVVLCITCPLGWTK